MSVNAPSFRQSVRSLLRERLLDAAARITAAEGWGAVTMAKLAEEVGVSRQTVYNELGSKPAIAEELVMRELARFLDVVRSRMSEQDDVVPALRAAAEGVLEEAARNRLLRSVLESAHTGGSDLLPLLTTEAQSLIEMARVMVVQTVAELDLHTGLDPAELDVAVDAVIRLVLSHVMQPAKSPSEAADDIAWIAGHVLHDVQHSQE